MDESTGCLLATHLAELAAARVRQVLPAPAHVARRPQLRWWVVRRAVRRGQRLADVLVRHGVVGARVRQRLLAAAREPQVTMPRVHSAGAAHGGMRIRRLGSDEVCHAAGCNVHTRQFSPFLSRHPAFPATTLCKTSNRAFAVFFKLPTAL